MILVTGDTHADITRFSFKQIKKLKRNDFLIICGDFGFIWENNTKEKKILKKIGKRKFYTLFVEGTHENFDALNQYETVDFNGGKARHICGNLYQLLRGEVYTFNGKTFFTFGGGESPDKDIKSFTKTYWENELPCINEMKKGVANLNKVDRRIDYIITHEPPGKIKENLSSHDEPNINALNRFFDDIVKEVTFSKWFFGSTHINKLFTQKYISLFNDVVNIE